MRNSIKKQFWLTEEQANDLKHKSDITGLTEVDLIRVLLKGYHPKEKPDMCFYDAFRQLSFIVNDLTQLVRKADSLDCVDALLIEKEIESWKKFRSDFEQKYLEPDKAKIIYK